MSSHYDWAVTEMFTRAVGGNDGFPVFTVLVVLDFIIVDGCSEGSDWSLANADVLADAYFDTLGGTETCEYQKRADGSTVTPTNERRTFYPRELLCCVDVERCGVDRFAVTNGAAGRKACSECGINQDDETAGEGLSRFQQMQLYQKDSQRNRIAKNSVPHAYEMPLEGEQAVCPPAVQEQEEHDESRPFRYTKEEILRIYKEGGGKGGLGLEVERWEGIVHEAGSEPASLRKMDEAEKKLFAGPLNSEIRRRQPSDLVNTLSSTSDRPRVNHVGGGGGPVRDRFGPMMGRRRVIEANGIAFNNGMINGLSKSQYNSPTRSQYSQPSASFSPSAQHQAVSPFGEALTQPSVSPHVSYPPTSAVQANSGTSPWPDPSPVCRMRTVDTSATSSPAVTSAQVQQGFNWARLIQPPQAVPQLKDPSPWLTASLGGTDNRWKQIPDGQGAEDVFVAGSPIDGGVPTPPVLQTPADELPVASAVPIPVSQPVPPSSEPQVTSQPSLTVPKGTPASVVKGPSPVPIISPPAPQICVEAEAKMEEAHKASEKEWERACSNIVTSLVASGSEDTQPFTASWGLLTSQAGGRNTAAPKEPPMPVTPSAPVWMTVAPTATVKKSMKEIQEEEERMKKVVVRESVASAAARRPYAETIFKTAPSAQNTGSGAWTTIGANGKPATPVAAPPQPAVTTVTTPGSTVAVGSPATVPRQHGAAMRPGMSAAMLSPTKPAATPHVEDSPVTPSNDFLKRLSDSLKGLNSSINLEEITSMLFSFPLDPDPSTIEIISDLIYANSTTLDGRRFASEYVNKRKADAAARRNAAGVGGNSGKPISIADVVKTQPKTVQQEWGFKVVNKKKKGGRS
ncbi:hypothetical protein BKA82DRAFT_4516287 [Pisolithus tinctorius]|nr:hypothetical protein BKA82DRAFT_4516287 [Pisolithus tinctorius]